MSSLHQLRENRLSQLIRAKREATELCAYHRERRATRADREGEDGLRLEENYYRARLAEIQARRALIEFEKGGPA